MKNKILGTVILYNPDQTVIDNVNTYIDYVDELVIVDNSDIYDQKIIEKLLSLPKTTYISNNGNVGIARALNVAAEYGFNRSFKWLLTMDQDSLFEGNNIQLLMSDLEVCESKISNLGILTPFHETQTVAPLKAKQNNIFRVKTCMTSGNIINLKVWNETGGLLEKLFIDYVDHEYCLRIRKFGNVIYQTNNSRLRHFLGNSKSFKFLGTRTASHHNYLRRYYLTRNRLYMISRYFFFDPGTCLYEVYNLFSETIKMLMQENNKIQKLKSIKRGLFDFVRGKYGKYSYSK